MIISWIKLFKPTSTRSEQIRKQYVADDISKRYGHLVLGLFLYNSIFNPIEWILKEKIKYANVVLFQNSIKRLMELVKCWLVKMTTEDPTNKCYA